MPLLTGKQSDFLKVAVAAAGRGDLATIEAVLELKPDWHLKAGSHGRTMLWEAAYRGKLAVVRFLMSKGADINARGCHFTPHRLDISAYCAASIASREDVTHYLSEQGAVIGLDTAAYLNNVGLVTQILDENPALAGSEVKQWEGSTEPVLAYAVFRGTTDVVSTFLDHGATIGDQSANLLSLAGEQIEIIDLLLNAGADPMAAPLILEGAAADFYRERGATADLNRPQKWPPLIYHCRGDRGEQPEKIRKLLDLGADPDIRDYKGKTALHRAATAGFLKDIEVLLAAGADVNATDHAGDTPLFDAMRAKRPEATQALLRAGASKSSRNNGGSDPMALAKRLRGEEGARVRAVLDQSK